jgi:hypothetical protein
MITWEGCGRTEEGARKNSGFLCKESDIVSSEQESGTTAIER